MSRAFPSTSKVAPSLRRKIELGRGLSLVPLIEGIAARLEAQPAARPFLPLLASLRALTPSGGKDPSSMVLPVECHWPAAIAADPLAPVLHQLADEMRRRDYGWRQNPNYRAQPPSPAFLANYGYFEYAGPDAPWHSNDLRLGVLLLGPATLYPRHHHAAEEVYLPLGPGRWFKDDEDWQDKTSGAVIHHPPECGHATKSGTTPLAAIYLWRGAITEAAEIS